jgi:hypothetical protein
MPQKLTPEIITAAIEGFKAQKISIDAQIAELRSLLTGDNTESATTPVTGKPRRKFSAASRRKMAAAQQARWAGIKQGSEPMQPVSAKPKKRKMSAAGRKAISDATKKRWAAKKAAAKTA